MPVASPSRRRDPAATRLRWQERLARFRSAGQTIAQFCAAEGISVPSFYVWQRTLAADAPAAAATGPRLVPIRLTPSPTGAVELALPFGAVLRFPPDTRPELLVAVLRGLEGRPC